jgi:hypothetical protein
MRDDFDRLFYGLETAAAQVSSGAWSGETAQAQLVKVKAEAMQFAARLLKVTDDIKRQSATGAPQPPLAPAPAAAPSPAAPAVAASPAAPATKAEPPAPTDRPSFLSQLGARVQKHFDQL